ncbi:MAG: type II toxin-antitoxin system VapC family toxin [Candidatus Paceibacteria bacterium]
MDRYFLNTSFLLAFIDSDDDHHQKSREIMGKIRDEEVYISDRVFTETVNTIFSRFDHSDAENFSDYLRKSGINILHTNSVTFSMASELFESEKVSFTDCSIIALMKALNIEKLCTFDSDCRDFENIEIVN